MKDFGSLKAWQFTGSPIPTRTKQVLTAGEKIVMGKFSAALAWNGTAYGSEFIKKALTIKGIISLDIKINEQVALVEAEHPLALEKLENLFLSEGAILTSEKALLKIDCKEPDQIRAEAKTLHGVLSASFWKKNTLVISYLPRKTDLDLICRSLAEKLPCQVEKTYAASPFSFLLEGRQGKVFILSGFFLFLGLALKAAYPSAATASYTLAALVGGLPILQAAWSGLKDKEINFNILVLIALTAAMLSGHYLAAAEVAFLMSLGVLLEEYTQKRSFEASTSLLQFLPRHALRKTATGEESVPLQNLKVGDTVLLPPGQRSPADGIIIKGRSWMDQSALTGESAPVEKGPGNPVLSGSLSVSGLLEIKAEKVGEETSIFQTAALLEQHLNENTTYARYIDRIAAYLLPLVLLTALLALWVTGETTVAVTILIGACPCALVMATPSATRAGIINASLNGILIKGGRHLEILATISYIALDKTGTLTTSSHKLVNMHPYPPWKKDELLSLAASAEKYSEHPLARAIKKEALAKGLELEEIEHFSITPGGGVSAIVNDNRVVLKSALRENVIIPANAPKLKNAVAIILEVNGLPAGLFYLRGETKKEALSAIEGLRKTGLKEIAILSGDSEEATKSMAEELGVNKYYAELLPAEKVQLIRDMKQKGHRVAMVGDGINDGPALAAADLGIAMGLRGTDLAVDSSSVVLMSDNLLKLPYLFRLGGKSAAIIRQNILFSCLVIVLLVAFAFMGYVGPAAGAILHKGSTVVVLLNAMRLMSFKS